MTETPSYFQARRSYLLGVGILAAAIGTGVVVSLLQRSGTPVASGFSNSRQYATQAAPANAPASPGTSHVKPGASKQKDLVSSR